MQISFRRAVQNCLVFVLDTGTRDIPEIDGRADFWATPTCIAVGCLPDSDGDTEINIGTAEHGTPSGSPLVDRVLSTPNRALVFDLVHERSFHQIPVANDRTRIRIWMRNYRDSDYVTFVIGG